MFPVTDKYIESQYIKNKTHVRLSNELQNEVINKATKVLSLYNGGMKKIVFTNIDNIIIQLLEEK